MVNRLNPLRRNGFRIVAGATCDDEFAASAGFPPTWLARVMSWAERASPAPAIRIDPDEILAQPV